VPEYKHDKSVNIYKMKVKGLNGLFFLKKNDVPVGRHVMSPDGNEVHWEVECHMCGSFFV